MRGARRCTAYRYRVAFLFALTIPGLAVTLVLLGTLDLLVFRRFGARLLGERGTRAAPAAYDEAAAVFHPGKRLELDQRQTTALLRQTADEGAPPRVSVDLYRGTAVIRRRAAA